MPKLTLREWTQILADLYSQEKAIKEQERKAARARRR